MKTTGPHLHFESSSAEDTYPGDLDVQQRARAEALDRAHTVLAARTPVSSSTVDALDLVNVASWIITGDDPWAHLTPIPEAATSGDQQ